MAVLDVADRLAALAAPPDKDRCGEVYQVGGGVLPAVCELEPGHEQNHRGPFKHGIAQWPRGAAPPDSEREQLIARINDWMGRYRGDEATDKREAIALLAGARKALGAAPPDRQETACESEKPQIPPAVTTGDLSSALPERSGANGAMALAKDYALAVERANREAEGRARVHAALAAVIGAEAASRINDGSAPVPQAPPDRQEQPEQEDLTRVDGERCPEQPLTAATIEAIRIAFREGYSEGFGRNSVYEPDDAWDRSRTKAELPAVGRVADAGTPDVAPRAGEPDHE